MKTLSEFRMVFKSFLTFIKAFRAKNALKMDCEGCIVLVDQSVPVVKVMSAPFTGLWEANG